MNPPWGWAEATKTTSGDCLLQGTAHCRGLPTAVPGPPYKVNECVSHLPSLPGEMPWGWGRGTPPRSFKSPVQKAFWGQVTTYSFPERQALLYSYCKHLQTPQAERSRRFADLRRTQGVPWTFGFQGWQQSLMGGASFSLSTFLEDHLTLTLYSPQFVFSYE